MSEPEIGDERTTLDGSPIDGQPRAGNRTSRRAVLGGGVVLGGAAVASFAPWMSEDAAAIGTGQGRATISWAPGETSTSADGNPPQPFSGRIRGMRLSGVSRALPPPANFGSTSGGAKSILDVPFQSLEGKLGGKSFHLSVSLGAGRSASGIALEGFKVTGKYGSESVLAFLGAPTSEVSSGSPLSPLRFSGMIGTMKVEGVVANPHRHSVTARFTVSGR